MCSQSYSVHVLLIIIFFNPISFILGLNITSNRGSNVSDLTDPVRCLTSEEVQQAHPFRKTTKMQPNGRSTNKMRTVRRFCMATGCKERTECKECFNEACRKRKVANGAEGVFYCPLHFNVHWKDFLTTDDSA